MPYFETYNGFIKLNLNFPREKNLYAFQELNDSYQFLAGVASALGGLTIPCVIKATSPIFTNNNFVRDILISTERVGKTLQYVPVFDRSLVLNYTIKFMYQQQPIGGGGSVSIDIRYPKEYWIGDFNGHSYFATGYSDKSNSSLSDTIRFDKLIQPSYAYWWSTGLKSSKININWFNNFQNKNILAFVSP